MAKDPYELDKDRNPCTYKKVCEKCIMARPEHRPTRCKEIACDDLTQCKKCSRNMLLNGEGYCQYCDPKSKKIAIKDADGNIQVIPREAPTHPLLQGSTASKMVDGETGKVRSRELGIYTPGTPPDALSDSEKAYYNIQWKEYHGYYRDPSAYALCHNIILLEIELDFLSNWMIANRDKPDRDMENKQNRLIGNMKALRDQLPEADALEQTEDEMVIAMIHKRYIEEAQDRRAGGIARFISQDAVALAPHLEFPVDIVDIGVRLGYRMVDMVEALNHFATSGELPSDPKKFLEFLGFHLKQNYALQDGDTIPQDDYEPIIQDDQVDEELVAETKTPEDEPTPKPPRMSPPKNDDDDNPFAIVSD